MTARRYGDFDMLSCVDELGSGRIRLPLDYIGKYNLTYGQPVTVECELSGSKQQHLCIVSVAAAAGAAAFDPSVQCGLHTEPLQLKQGSRVLLSVKPVSSKVTTATSVKVLAPDKLLGSAVPAAHLQQRLLYSKCTLHLSPSVSCQIVEVNPAGSASAVYRVVPSTTIHLSSSSSTSAQAAAAPATPQGSQLSIAAGASGSSRSTHTKSKSVNSRKDSAAGATGRSLSTSSSGSSKQPSSKKKNSKKKGDGSPVAASGGMFDLLDALGDD